MGFTYSEKFKAVISSNGKIVTTKRTNSSRMQHFKASSREVRRIIPVHRFIGYLKFGEKIYQENIWVYFKDGNINNFEWDNIEIGSEEDARNARVSEFTQEDRIKFAQNAGKSTSKSLSDETWKAIEKDYRENGFTYKTLNEKYGVAKGTLSYRLSKSSNKRGLDNRNAGNENVELPITHKCSWCQKPQHIQVCPECETPLNEFIQQSEEIEKDEYPNFYAAKEQINDASKEYKNGTTLHRKIAGYFTLNGECIINKEKYIIRIQGQNTNNHWVAQMRKEGEYQPSIGATGIYEKYSNPEMVTTMDETQESMDALISMINYSKTHYEEFIQVKMIHYIDEINTHPDIKESEIFNPFIDNITQMLANFKSIKGSKRQSVFILKKWINPNRDKLLIKSKFITSSVEEETMLKIVENSK